MPCRSSQNDQAIPYVKEASAGDAAPEIRARCARILERCRADLRWSLPCHLEEMVRRGEFSRAMRVAFFWRRELKEKLVDFEQLAAQSLSDATQQNTNRPRTVPKFPNPKFLREFGIEIG